jgi:predicted alpha/beta-hydrolase family hydrolase
MAAGKARVDRADVAEAAVRATVEQARRHARGLSLFAGGKSFGGRMTSQAHAKAALPVRGLVFFGFPLHPPDAPAITRAEHLPATTGPLLFLQGTRDELADLALLRPVVHDLGARATLHVVDAADHGFDVLVRSGRTPEEVLAELAETTAAWMDRVSS